MLIDFFNYILSAIFVFHIKLAKKICKISVVISDSHSDINQHILWRIKCIRPEILIHSGDWSTIDVYYDLAEYCKKIIGVAGNVESLQTDEFFRQSEIIEINNKKIFVIHELENKSLFLEKNNKYDLVIYGHTHRPTKKKIRDTFFFNAGSCGPKRYSNIAPSFGVIYFFKNIFFCRIFKIPFQKRRVYF